MKKLFLLSALLSATVTLMAQTASSEYCNYSGEETKDGDTYVTLTWETESNGDVVITIGQGEGVTECSFRNGGFEGGIAAFVVSTDNFQSSTPASDYFTSTQVYSGNTYTLVKNEGATVPAGAKIKHIGEGHAFAWKVNGKDAWSNPDFIYTYGTVCAQIDAPTNVQVSADSVITFTGVAGASKYTAYVYLNDAEMYRQEVVSGDVLHFFPFVSGTYQVTVVANSGAGNVDSEHSDSFNWYLNARTVVVGKSEYCETEMANEVANGAPVLFTWETTEEGNIVITIAEVEGDVSGETLFRAAMKAENFRIGAGNISGDNYFTASISEDKTQSILTLKDDVQAPVKGEKITYNAVVEYATSQNNNAWPTIEFEYTYGSVCSDNNDTPTGLNSVSNAVKVKKLMQNGMMIIEIDGIRYNTLGQRITQ